MSSRALPAPADQVASAELLMTLSAVERDLGWLAEMIRPLVGAGMTILTLPWTRARATGGPAGVEPAKFLS